MEAMAELGLLDRFLQRPHSRIEELSGVVGGETIRIADFRRLPVRAPFIAIMPQWDFLTFLAGEGARFPEFQLMMRAEARTLTQRDGRVVGLTASTPDGEVAIDADLVIAADGRDSRLRGQAGLTLRDIGAPIDVLWMRLPRRPDDRGAPLGYIAPGAVFVMIDRGDYFQCGYVTPKGERQAVRDAGLPALRAKIAKAAPLAADRLDAIKDWDDVKLLSVSVDRLERWWRPGLLCIGDAAHAMSPIGGVGINLAVADAVVAGNVVAAAFRRGGPTDADLAAVQSRRTLPMRVIQAFQVAVQNRVLKAALAADKPFTPPWIVRQSDRHAWLRRLPARLLGLGVRLEHVRAPDIHAKS
jgi:2-polyprenyl-6-methoxyphenol hydroxylase-like FAD-dependent oxidoreductase